jgi:hypothetical protein
MAQEPALLQEAQSAWRTPGLIPSAWRAAAYDVACQADLAGLPAPHRQAMAGLVPRMRPVSMADPPSIPSEGCYDPGCTAGGSSEFTCGNA